MSYVDIDRSGRLPRLPLQGSLDLTYRCNNTCRHCWLWLPEHAPEQRDELSFDEIRHIADESRALGCRKWSISGGEPMLRPDFPEIFDFLTSRSISYSLNTNGTLITPAIAQLMKRNGRNMVALYGATAEVYDGVTRNPGGFELVMQGFRYLQEAGAPFMVQLIPMRSNWHQWDDMVKLAQTLSPHCRIGASWLFLSACGSPRRNAEIRAERLDPADVVALDPPDMSSSADVAAGCGSFSRDDRLFANCIAARREFHIDPYGRMTFCAFIKDPALRCDLREGTFRDAWENFIPSLADKVRADQEYFENCSSCDHRPNCRCCPVYAYLEHRRFSAPISYLCETAREHRCYQENWRTHHRRFFRLAGMTVQVDSDLPFQERTLHWSLQPFEVDGPGDDTVRIRHRFKMPDWAGNPGEFVAGSPPCSLYHRKGGWVYIESAETTSRPAHIAVTNADHSNIVVYHPDGDGFAGALSATLSFLCSDALLLVPLLASRDACMFHAGGVVLDGQGFLFVGNSGAGKSTLVGQLRSRAEILCDERIIVRRREEGFRIYGSWKHSTVDDLSAADAPLRGIFLLHQSPRNRLVPLTKRQAISDALLPSVLQPLSKTDWWPAAGNVITGMAGSVPAYSLEFDLSGGIVALLEQLAAASCLPRQ